MLSHPGPQQSHETTYDSSPRAIYIHILAHTDRLIEKKINKWTGIEKSENKNNTQGPLSDCSTIFNTVAQALYWELWMSRFGSGSLHGVARPSPPPTVPWGAAEQPRTRFRTYTDLTLAGFRDMLCNFRQYLTNAGLDVAQIK